MKSHFRVNINECDFHLTILLYSNTAELMIWYDKVFNSHVHYLTWIILEYAGKRSVFSPSTLLFLERDEHHDSCHPLIWILSRSNVWHCLRIFVNPNLFLLLSLMGWWRVRKRERENRLKIKNKKISDFSHLITSLVGNKPIYIIPATNFGMVVIT